MMSDRFRWGLGDAWDWYLGYYRRTTLVFVVLAAVVLTCTFLAGRGSASEEPLVRESTRPPLAPPCYCRVSLDLGPCAPALEVCECPDGTVYQIKSHYDPETDMCVLIHETWPAKE